MRCLLLILLTGCAHTDAIQAGIADRGAAISDEAQQSAEWILCKAISVGAWRRAYGSDQKKADAWRVLCSDAVGQTP